MAADVLGGVASEVRACELCPLHESRKNAVPGDGPADAAVVIVGEAPGANEDERGLPFVGAAGKNLEGLLAMAGLSRADVFITNTVKCRPPANRKPRRDELDSCHPYLRRQLEAVRPRLVVLLGGTALKEFFPSGSLSSMHGKVARKGDYQFLPTYHPASVMYNRSLTPVLEGDFVQIGRAVSKRSD